MWTNQLEIDLLWKIHWYSPNMNQNVYYSNTTISSAWPWWLWQELAQLPVVTKDLLGEVSGCTWSWGFDGGGFIRLAGGIANHSVLTFFFSPFDAPCYIDFFLFNWNQTITLAFSSNEVYHLVDDIGHRPLLSKGWWAMTHHLALFVRPSMLRNSGCWRPTTFPLDVVVSMVIGSLIMDWILHNSWISNWTFGFTGLTTKK